MKNTPFNIKFLIVVFVFTGALIPLLAQAKISDNNSGFVIYSTVFAQNEQDCNNLTDKVKGLDENDISRLLSEDSGDGGQGLLDLRDSLNDCITVSNLDNPIKPDDLEKLDPVVIAMLGPDIIHGLVR
jgi:hypothetical protein